MTDFEALQTHGSTRVIPHPNRERDKQSRHQAALKKARERMAG